MSEGNELSPARLTKAILFRVCPPGSGPAIDLGCVCPVFDNAFGRGAWGTAGLPAADRVYVVNADCPLHGTAAADLIIPQGGDGGD